MNGGGGGRNPILGKSPFVLEHFQQARMQAFVIPNPNPKKSKKVTAVASSDSSQWA